MARSQAFPFHPGTTLNIQSHSPPYPYGMDYGNQREVRQPVEGMQDMNPSVDRIEFALAHPPLSTPPPKNIRTDVLNVCEVIHGPQQHASRAYLVRCRLASDSTHSYVAKIYDGVNYPLDDCYLDCMYLADKDYSREATAYENIPSRFQGFSVPRYFGSWTFALDTNRPGHGRRGKQRWVRMILIEYIQGDAMLDLTLKARNYNSRIESTDVSQAYNHLDYSLLPPETERLDVLARVIEIAVALNHAGIHHKDVHPRNIMITRPDKRVVLIDFECTLIHRLSKRKPLLPELNDPDLPPLSPIVRYWNKGFGQGDFKDWVPQSWRENRDLEVKWLCDRWGRSEAYRLSDRFLQREGSYLVKKGLLPHLTAQFGDDWLREKAAEPSDDE